MFTEDYVLLKGRIRDVPRRADLAASNFSDPCKMRDVVADEPEFWCRLANGHVADAVDRYFVPTAVCHKRNSV
jgi:hypothetical protein